MRKLTFLGVALLFSFLSIAQNTIIQIMENHTAHFFYSFFVMYFENPQLNYFITTRMAIKVLGNADNKSPPAFPTNTKSTTATRKVNLPTRSNPNKHKTPSGANPNLYQKAVSLLGEPHLYDYIGARHGDIQLKVTGIYHSLDKTRVQSPMIFLT